MKQLSSIGITKAEYCLPRKRVDLGYLAERGLLASSPEPHRSFGFEYAYIAADTEELHQLLLESAERALADVPQPERVHVAAVILYSGIPYSPDEGRDRDLGIFEYMLPRLLHDLGMAQCRGYALSQQGCSGLISALELSRDILTASEKKFVLCLGADRFPNAHRREVIYNIVSDAAGAFLVSKDPERNIIRAFHQRSNMALWNTREMEDQILATYFPMATRAIQAALLAEELTPRDITWFIPHNVSRRSWQMLAQLVPFPIEKVWLENVARVGHTAACDHIINLHDMERRGIIKKGDRLFFFTFGFGAHWSSMIVEH